MNRILNSTNKLSQKRVHITETNRILNSTNKTKSEKSAHNRHEQDTQQYK